MDTYDPNSETTPITIVEEVPPEEVKKTVPTGLLRPEKKVEDDQMADFSSPIEEVMPGPGQMMQNEVMGPPPSLMSGNVSVPRSSKKKAAASQNPFGLTDEQFMAAIAGVAAIAAYSSPVQDKLSTMVPKFLNEAGKQTMTGMIVTALVAAIIFYFAKQFIKDRV
jgi:hypothetical protein